MVPRLILVCELLLAGPVAAAQGVRLGDAASAGVWLRSDSAQGAVALTGTPAPVAPEVSPDGVPIRLACCELQLHGSVSGRRPVWARPLVLGSIVVLLTGMADREIRDEVKEHGGSGARDIGVEISRAAPPLALGIGAGLLGVGLLSGRHAIAGTGRDALVAMGAAGLLTQVVKVTIGRARPYTDHGTHYFAPFRTSTRYNSFPSGHTSQAFALAAVIAAHTQEPAIRVAAYGAATIVGAARVAADRHFASDVVAGAILGTVVGRAVVHRLATSSTRVLVSPVVGSGGLGWMVAGAF